MTGRCKLTVDNNLGPHMTVDGNCWTADACVQLSNNSKNLEKTALAGGRTSRIWYLFSRIKQTTDFADNTDVVRADDHGAKIVFSV